MNSHLMCLTFIHGIRALGGLALAGLFLYFSVPENVPRHLEPTLSRYHALEPGDPLAFRAIGLGTGFLSLVRLGHALYSFGALKASWRAGWRSGLFRPGALRRSRLLGRVLAWIDLIDLTFFPVTTACGLYGLLIYGHADTIDFFEARFAGS